MIKIMYELYTDGDYSLRTPEKFGCTAKDDEYYAGEVTSRTDTLITAKCEAKPFLEQLLCDGLHVLYTHYQLIKYFYEMIDEPCEFISSNEEGYVLKDLSGNYDGTCIGVAFLKGEQQDDKNT